MAVAPTGYSEEPEDVIGHSDEAEAQGLTDQNGEEASDE